MSFRADDLREESDKALNALRGVCSAFVKHHESMARCAHGNATRQWHQADAALWRFRLARVEEEARRRLRVFAPLRGELSGSPEWRALLSIPRPTTAKRPALLDESRIST